MHELVNERNELKPTQSKKKWKVKEVNEQERRSQFALLFINSRFEIEYSLNQLVGLEVMK